MISELCIFVLIATILKSCDTNINIRNNLSKSKYYKENMETVFSRKFGSYLYKAEDELRMRLQDTGITVSRINDQIILNMPSHIVFRSDELVLNEDILPILESISVVLNKFKNTSITISGHTDSVGTLQHNMDLSQKYADVIMNELISHNVIQQRIHSRGYAYKFPIDTNDTQEGRQNNKRVEIEIHPY